MRLRDLAHTIAVLFSLLTTGALASNADAQGKATQQKKRPNIVVILVDDLGWMDLSCQGSKYYRTPHIDRLAAEGIRFTDGYAAAAICSPTRAALMTGRYPARTGVTDWIRARFQRGGIGTPARNPTEYVGGPNRPLLCPPNPFWLEHSETTIAELLRQLGYICCHIGKWHLGDDAWFPTKQGFHLNLGGCDYGQPPSYFDPYRNRRLKQGIPTLQPREKGEYLTDREADEAVAFIRKNKDRPFFLHMAHYAVHTPIQAKKDIIAKYATEKKKQGSPAYAAMVESVDDAVGKIMQTLRDLGLDDNTLVIFTSDNGGLLGPTNNAPLRSGKGYAYEGGIRVPWIVRWPGVIPSQKVSRQPIHTIDIFPTVAEAAGAKLPKQPIDGVSLLGHLKTGGKQKLKREALFWHFPHYRHRPGPYSIVREGDWKLTKFYEGPVFELYNLKNDIGEKSNMAAKQPKLVARLHGILQDHLRAVGAKLPRPNPKYRSKK